jgi:transketolase
MSQSSGMESMLAKHAQPVKRASSLANFVTLPPQELSREVHDNGTMTRLADPTGLRALVLLMDMSAAFGGAASHFGGPSAFAELVSAVYGFMQKESEALGSPWYELFELVNDAGHCENVHYAVRACYQMGIASFDELLKFRSLGSPLTGHGEAHLFPEGVRVSNGPLGSAFVQSQGLAMGAALSGDFRTTTLCFVSDGALMEGEAREALASIPGLAHKKRVAPYVVILSDNNTKLSGRIDEDSFSMQPSFQSLEALGWHVIRLEEAHNLQKCWDTLKTAIHTARQNPLKPVCIWAKTIKGYGLKKSEQSPSGGHGFSVKNLEELKAALIELYGSWERVPSLIQRLYSQLPDWEQATKATKQKRKESWAWPAGVATDASLVKMQEGVSQALIESLESGYPVVSVTSDLPGSTGVAEFRKKFPERSIDVGVAEANMVSVASGMALRGWIPVVDTFAQFATTKGALPLLMSSLSQSGVIGVFSHVGFQDAADGASHQSLNYLAFTLGIPGVEVFSVSCAREAYWLLKKIVSEFAEALKTAQGRRSYIVFLGRENFPRAYLSDKDYQSLALRSNHVVYQSSKSAQVLVVASGTMLPRALEAAWKIESQGGGVVVVHPTYLNQPDEQLLGPWLRQVNYRVIFAEDHQVTHGLGEHWLVQWVQSGLPIKSRIVGVSKKFGCSAYESWELHEHYGNDAQALVRAFNELTTT